ncbi:hypothetical protein QMK17_05895 [Rhodococcus sp. G-MC3]|nr:hypothetical protein [Rhodococcus sp. G-MC3]MDJ0392860.1 hypothetical protein [Rhodococcus sp. G-MC3]
MDEAAPLRPSARTPLIDRTPHRVAFVSAFGIIVAGFVGLAAAAL